MNVENSVSEPTHFHMVGVSGMGMAPLALFLKKVGYHVTGEDDNFHPRVHQMLLNNGVELSRKTNYGKVDRVIYSNAIGLGHPSIKDAKSHAVPLTRRGEVLAELSARYKTIAVAGSHGKTTTCGMLIHALLRAGFPCNYILGGLFSGDVLLPAGASDQSPWLVIEIDESDGSIQSFKPSMSLVVNVDWDHADFYRTKKKCIQTFQDLIDRTSDHVFINGSCELSAELNLGGTHAAVHTFGAEADIQLLKFEDRVMTLAADSKESPVTVSFDEPFNALNALAALSVVKFLVGEWDRSLLKDFPGLWRRQELLYEKDGFSVIEDYGHHPTEIKRLFEALAHRKGPLTVVFQPHRYSRTLQFKYEFSQVLADADCALIMEVYAAGESEILGGTGVDLFEAYADVSPEKDSYFCKDGPAVLRQLDLLKIDSGILLFLGAGDIQNVALSYVERLSSKTENSESDFVSDMVKLVSSESKILANEPLASKTTLRVGGIADYFAEPADETDLKLLLLEASKRSIDVHFMGRGSNLLIPDKGVRGLVLRLTKPFFRQIEMLEDGRVRAGAGVRLKELCGFMRKHEIAGFEFLEGIPGNVGGALKMNAGAMGGWISEVISEVVLMSYHGDISVVPFEDLHFGYRHCLELDDMIGLGVIFKAGSASSVLDVQHTMDTYQNSRKESQPRLPSAGCSFKNPKQSAAGKLIDECQLKGYSVGGAEVSDIHANFIVNRGHATASDVIALINDLRKKVYSKTGYELEPEVILFGDKWQNYLDPLPTVSVDSLSVSQP